MEKIEEKANRGQNIIILWMLTEFVIYIIFTVKDDIWMPYGAFESIILWLLIYLKFRWARYVHIVFRIIGIVYIFLIAISKIYFGDPGILMTLFHPKQIYDIMALCFLLFSKQVKGMYLSRVPLSEEIQNEKSYKVIQLCVVFGLFILIQYIDGSIGSRSYVGANIFDVVNCILLFFAGLNTSFGKIRKELILSIVAGIALWFVKLLVYKGIAALILNSKCTFTEVALWGDGISNIIICISIGALIILCKKILKEKIQIVKDKKTRYAFMASSISWIAFTYIIALSPIQDINMNITYWFTALDNTDSVLKSLAFLSFAVSFSLLFFNVQNLKEKSADMKI